MQMPEFFRPSAAGLCRRRAEEQARAGRGFLAEAAYGGTGRADELPRYGDRRCAREGLLPITEVAKESHTRVCD